MSGYADSLTVEERGRKRLSGFFRGWSRGAPLLELTSREDQKFRGDYVVTQARGDALDVELKTVAGSYSHFFLETWSNKAHGTRGWLYTSRAHRLVYHYQEDDRLFIIDLPALQRWLLLEDNIANFLWHEVQQEKYQQMNDTWGVLILHDTVREAIGFKWEGLVPPDDPHLCHCGQYGTRSSDGGAHWYCMAHDPNPPRIEA